MTNRTTPPFFDALSTYWLKKQAAHRIPYARVTQLLRQEKVIPENVGTIPGVEEPLLARVKRVFQNRAKAEPVQETPAKVTTPTPTVTPKPEVATTQPVTPEPLPKPEP